MLYRIKGKIQTTEDQYGEVENTERRKVRMIEIDVPDKA